MRGIQESIHGEGQYCVAEQHSQLACVQSVKHERVDGVEQSGAESRWEHCGAQQARRPGRCEGEEDHGRDDRACLPEDAIEEGAADRERDSPGQGIVEAEGFRWQQRLARAGDEVQQE